MFNSFFVDGVISSDTLSATEELIDKLDSDGVSLASVREETE
jgi:hypothetical protein